MENIDDKYYLDKCKKEIENVLGIGDSRNWKQRDFEYLCDQIYQSVKTNISLSTIKRIWNSEFKNAPQPATLNALAVFLGYNDWNSFKKAVPKENQYISNTAEKDRKRKGVPNFKKIAVAILALLVISISIYYISSFVHSKQIKSNIEQVVFEHKKTDTTYPNSVVFYYDIAPIKPKRLTIQQSWDTRMTLEANPLSNYKTCIYYFPGYFTAKLFADDILLKEHKLLLPTNGWLPMILHEWGDSIPYYVRNRHFANTDSVYISPKIIKDQNIPIGEYFLTDYMNVQDYMISGDNYKFEATIKNSIKEGGLLCQRSWILIIGEHGWFYIMLSAKGCISDNRLGIAEKYWDGKDYDLSAFGCNMNDWNKLKLESINKKVTISLNNSNIFATDYNNSIGNLYTVCIVFEGCGAFKDVSLQTLDNQ